MADERLNNLALSIEHSQRIQVAADGTATRGYETFIKKYVGMIESGLLARLTGTANKLLDAMGLRARILADPRRPESEDEFQLLKQLGIATDPDRGELFCFASLDRLARDTGISSLHTVESGIDQLIKLRIVRKVSAKGQRRLASGRYGSNVYFIQPESFIGKFDSESHPTAGSDHWQKLPRVSPTVGSSPITVNRAIKRINQKQKEEDPVQFIAQHFVACLGARRYEPSEKEISKIRALLSEGYSTLEICEGITRAIDRAKAAGRKVRSMAYCIPAMREKPIQEANDASIREGIRSESGLSYPRNDGSRKAEMGSPQPSAVTGQPQAVIQPNPELEKLAGGDAELHDLLEVIQERNPDRLLRKSDVRAWRAVADRFRELASVRDTTPIGLVMQAVLKGIGANSDHEGFFAPSLAEAILENWQREQGDQQPAQTENTSFHEPNDHGRAVHRPSVRLPAIQTSDGSLDPVEVWDTALKELQRQMTKATFDTWVKSTFVLDALGGDDRGHAERSAPSAGQALGEPTIVIGTRNPYAVEWLEHRLHTTIQRTVTGIVGQSVTVKYQCVREEK